jgi:hypothetical protein
MTSAGGGHAPPTGRINASNTSHTRRVPRGDDSVSIGSRFQFGICGMVADANRSTPQRATAGRVWFCLCSGNIAHGSHTDGRVRSHTVGSDRGPPCPLTRTSFQLKRQRQGHDRDYRVSREAAAVDGPSVRAL